MFHCVNPPCMGQRTHCPYRHGKDVAAVICQNCYRHPWELSAWLRPNNKVLSLHMWPQRVVLSFSRHSLYMKRFTAILISLKHKYSGVIKMLKLCDFSGNVKILFLHKLCHVTTFHSYEFHFPQPKSKISASRKLSLKVSFKCHILFVFFTPHNPAAQIFHILS